jgi:energy-coupling factor transporter ATP-binding protein EcfA2
MSKSRSPKSSARSGTTRPKPGPATGGPSSGAPGKAAADPGKTVPASATPSDTSARPLGSSATPTSSGAPSSATPPAGKATPPAKAAPAAKASPAAARTELVRADRLNVGYGTKAVCGEIGFSLRQGEALAFVGPNGAGKSTVLKTVVGQLEAISGKTRVYGGDADDRSLEFRREVAMVFDDDAFFPALTVQEHLAIVAAGHGATDVEDLIDDELDFFGLSEQRQMLPHNLSSGQRRRMLLAAAFVRPRSLLVLDEPEQRLDTGMRERLAARLRQQVDDGLGLLVVTHDPAFLSTVATRAIFVADEVRKMTPAQAAVAISATNPRAD